MSPKLVIKIKNENGPNFSKTITMLNLIAIIWFDRVSPKLVNMIKFKNGAMLWDQEPYAL